jgi:hypothetical protein
VEGVKIVGLCVVAAIVYGVLHDLVTANLCVEYFSVFHPPIFHTDSPWLLALGWGFVATWWMGLFLGPIIAGASRGGILPKLGWRDLVKPLSAVLGCSYVSAFIAGFFGYRYVQRIPEWVYENVDRMQGIHFPPEKERLFTADLYAHNASYIVTTISALVLCIWIIVRRIQMGRDATLIQRIGGKGLEI